MRIEKKLHMRRLPQKANPWAQQKKRRTANRLTGRASRPVEAKNRFELLAGLEQSGRTGFLPRNDDQTCFTPPESEWWRKDPRSIPKVFLIDAYEVS